MAKQPANAGNVQAEVENLHNQGKIPPEVGQYKSIKLQMENGMSAEQRKAQNGRKLPETVEVAQPPPAPPPAKKQKLDKKQLERKQRLNQHAAQ